MRNMFVLGLLAASLTVGACGRSQADPGPDTTRKFALRDFDQVTLGGSDDVKVLYGRDFAVSATGPKEAVDALDIRQDGSTLLVTRLEEKGWKIGWDKRNATALVTVTMPLIRSAALSGAGDMTIASATPEDRFDAKLSGPGSMVIENSRAKAVDLSLTGAGNLKARGAADTLNAHLSGSGSMDAVALAAREVTVRLTGAGSITARASELATGTHSGVGNVDIAGTARCAVRKTGVGEVRCGMGKE